MIEQPEEAKPKKKGKKKTTGRYETRAELCDDVWSLYLTTPAKQADIARITRVSETTVANILDSKEGYPNA